MTWSIRESSRTMDETCVVIFLKSSTFFTYHGKPQSPPHRTPKISPKWTPKRPKGLCTKRTVVTRKSIVIFLLKVTLQIARPTLVWEFLWGCEIGVYRNNKDDRNLRDRRHAQCTLARHCQAKTANKKTTKPPKKKKKANGGDKAPSSRDSNTVHMRLIHVYLVFFFFWGVP